MLSKDGCSHLAEQFADIFQTAQEDYRALMGALRNDDVEIDTFSFQAEALLDQLVRLKRIRIQLTHEREELAKGEHPT